MHKEYTDKELIEDFNDLEDIIRFVISIGKEKGMTNINNKLLTFKCNHLIKINKRVRQ